MKLKDYQKASLATLREFFEEARISGPKAAYETITTEPELAARLRGYAPGYKPIKSLPDVTYVCLRLPTGVQPGLGATEACVQPCLGPPADDSPPPEMETSTTTGGGPVPVTRVDERLFSNGTAGPVTTAIQNTYWQWHEDPAMSEPVRGA